MPKPLLPLALHPKNQGPEADGFSRWKTEAMLAQTQVKLKNAESSIAFIRQQHARTLEGLHKEIQKLQQKNARLTYELAMRGPGPSTTTDCKNLEEELKSSKAEILDLRAALSSYAEEITVLEHRIEELQYKFGEKVRRRDARIEQLDLDLKEKSTAIANLTQQLHQTHIRLEAVAENDATVQYSTGAFSSMSGSTARKRRRVRRTTSSPTPPNVSSLAGNQPSSGARQLPLFIPRPPSSSSPYSTIPHPLVRRASSTGQRRSVSPEASSANAAEGPTPRPPGTSSSSLSTTRLSAVDHSSSLEPVSTHKYGEIPPDISDIILHQERGDIQAITRPSLPVLPPIRSDTTMTTLTSVPSSHSTQCASLSQLPSRLQYQQRHRHIVLAKSQGLSSAPSTMRVLRYNGRGLKQGENGVSGETAEGALLVKEAVNRKDQAWQELHQHGAD